MLPLEIKNHGELYFSTPSPHTLELNIKTGPSLLDTSLTSFALTVRAAFINLNRDEQAECHHTVRSAWWSCPAGEGMGGAQGVQQPPPPASSAREAEGQAAVTMSP